MLGKLLKYDFRSMLKQFAILWPAALAVALLNRIFFSFNLDSYRTGTIIQVLTMILYIAILMGMFVLAVVFVVQRFYKGLLGDEGYLMHTLPVVSWQLIASKILCAVVVTVVSIITAMASIFILVPDTKFMADFWRGLGELLRDPNGVLITLEVILFILTGMAQGYLMLYLAMGIGHLFHKNRVAMSVLAYIGMNWLLNFLISLTAFTVREPVEDFLTNLDAANVHTALWISIVWNLLLGAAFFTGTDYILRKKLNLE